VIFPGVLIIFTVSSFEFHQVKLPCLSLPVMNGPSSLHFNLLYLGAMLESYHKLQPKPKQVPKFKDALQLTWSALSPKVINNVVQETHQEMR